MEYDLSERVKGLKHEQVEGDEVFLSHLVKIGRLVFVLDLPGDWSGDFVLHPVSRISVVSP